MPIERVVGNASPLITLFKSKLVDLLPQLFSDVRIPPTVWQEVTATKDDVAAQTLPRVAWAKRVEVVAIEPAIAAWDLGAGESEVLSFALRHAD